MEHCTKNLQILNSKRKRSKSFAMEVNIENEMVNLVFKNQGN